MKNPKLIVKPFAKNGQKNVIPENYETSMESNQATWDQGFGQITMLPVAAGGLPPKGQDFNGIFNQISENIVYLSQGGRFKFSADYAEAIGGYPKGAILQSDDEKKEYLSLIDNNKVDFNTAADIGSSWELVGGNYATKADLANGLNKKVNTSDVSQVLGNELTKVPSLDLVTRELGKKASVTDANSKLAKDQNGADIPNKPKFLENIGLVPAVVLPKGYNIPFHIRNTPGILYSAQYPGTYTNEPDFDGEWFDVYSARHTSGAEGACTFMAVSRTGKTATASLIDTTFSGWNRVIDGTNTTAAGREIISKGSADEMVEYLGLDVISGRLLNVVTFTTSGTYTPSPGTKSIIVEAVGGGGASGNLGATGSNQNAVSAAGSNGAYAKARYTGGFSSVSVTIGAGGTVLGGGGGAGGDAGKTSFGALLNCPGGKGSKAGQPKSPPFNEGAAQPSGSPTGSGIIIAKNGMYSSWPTVVGLGMASNFANAIPSLLGEYGLGGDGVASGVSEPAVNGNAGNSGVVIVWEYS
ncbi:TPA: hypothetical protein ACGRG7_001092 [Morganella morganii]